MSFMDQIGSILNQYQSGATPDRTQAAEHYDEIARTVPPNVLASTIGPAVSGLDSQHLEERIARSAQQMTPDGGEPHQEIVAAVERLLRSRLRQQPRLLDVARTLNLSERSLRRKLAESGRIFREIHDRVRAERALELLRAGQLSVAEIGSEIGFSDPREFRRASKRWTGMPPQHARYAGD